MCNGQCPRSARDNQPALQGRELSDNCLDLVHHLPEQQRFPTKFTFHG